MFTCMEISGIKSSISGMLNLSEMSYRSRNHLAILDVKLYCVSLSRFSCKVVPFWYPCHWDLVEKFSRHYLHAFCNSFKPTRNVFYEQIALVTEAADENKTNTQRKRFLAIAFVTYECCNTRSTTTSRNCPRQTAQIRSSFTYLENSLRHSANGSKEFSQT